MRTASRRVGGFSAFTVRIQEIAVVAGAHQFFQLRRAQRIFPEVAILQLVSAALHEVASFFAGGAPGFLQELDAARTGWRAAFAFR
jgi:hypothetical protein